MKTVLAINGQLTDQSLRKVEACLYQNLVMFNAQEMQARVSFVSRSRVCCTCIKLGAKGANACA